MEGKAKHILDIRPYLKYFPESARTRVVVKKNSDLRDTIEFMPWMVERSLYQTKYFAPLMKGRSIYETCQNVWNWVYQHIPYQKDEPKKEQVKSAQRVVFDAARHIGSDCEDMAGLICGILTNLNIKTVFRIAKYTIENGFQHIYPIVPLPGGKYITVDCVVDRFNYEVPFIEKIDKPMDLEFLNGVPEGPDDAEDTNEQVPMNIDAQDLLDGNDTGFGSLGRGRGKFKNLVKNIQNSKAAGVVRNGLHIANRLNPAAGLLRAGILAAMKLNMFKIAERLRWGYLTPEQAQAKDLDMNKYNRLIGVKDQLEKIFFRAGGKLDSLRKEILTGRGNRNKEIPLSGLGAVDYANYTEDHKLSQILSPDTYYSELSGVEGLGSLGEPATAAAIAAATAALGAIAGLLKSIGSLRKGGSSKDSAASNSTGPDSASEDPATRATDNSSPESNSNNSTTSSPGGSNAKANASLSNNPAARPASNADASNPSHADSDGGANTDTPATNPSANGSDPTNAGEGQPTDKTDTPAHQDVKRAPEKTSANEGVFTKMGNWIKLNPIPATVGGMVIVSGLAYLGFRIFGKKEKPTTKKELAGIPKRPKSEGKLKIRRLR